MKRHFYTGMLILFFSCFFTGQLVAAEEKDFPWELFIPVITIAGRSANVHPPPSDVLSPLKLSDDIMYINEPKQVTFTIEIGSDDVQTVTLYQTDREGTIKTKASSCMDDGVLPDEIGSDGIYTARLTLQSSKEELLCYRISMTQTDNKTYLSGTQCIKVTSHYTNVQIDDAVKLADDVKYIYDNALGEGKSFQEAADTVVNSLKNITKMAKIESTAVGGVAWVTKDGILGAHHPVQEDIAAAGVEQAIFSNGKPKQEFSSVYSYVSLPEENEVQSKKAIIISPGIKFDPPSPSFGNGFGKKDNYYTSWEIIKNGDPCKLFAYRESVNILDPNWSWHNFWPIFTEDCGYIHIMTHGFPYQKDIWSLWEERWGDGEVHPGWGEIVLLAGIAIPKKQDGTYDISFLEDFIHKGRMVIYPSGELGVLPSFFDYVIPTKLPNSIIFLAACYSMYSDALKNVFLKHGAGAVVGFTNPANPQQTGDTSRTMLIELYKGKTVKEAFDYAKSIHVNASRNFAWDGNPNLKLSGSQTGECPEPQYNTISVGIMVDASWNDPIMNGDHLFEDGGTPCRGFVFDNSFSCNYSRTNPSTGTTVYGYITGSKTGNKKGDVITSLTFENTVRDKIGKLSTTRKATVINIPLDSPSFAAVVGTDVCTGNHITSLTAKEAYTKTTHDCNTSSYIQVRFGSE